ncbi:DUF488 domain-containing protein [candidate division WOR-3 bacterium]|uniref:DUF488 domain-containing protein n=1 Tax=candidate division WOR-3 bacterium TaxID=2052148 RepID=A0A660SG59_UNCW3|nr:MAG: DUF488 domain-containing protein [candidate division WOR-3 bacterium]
MKIYTLGTSNRKPYHFISILKKYCIEVIFDVRRFPTSKFEHFRGENLKRLCRENGISYIYFGNELGGYRKGGYFGFTTSKQFKEGIETIYDVARSKVVCIICAERFPWKCHRRYIGDALSKKGVEVEHIIDIDRSWQPKSDAAASR